MFCLRHFLTGVEEGLTVIVALGVSDGGAGAVSVDMMRSLFSAFDEAAAFDVLFSGLSDGRVVAATMLCSGV